MKGPTGTVEVAEEFDGEKVREARKALGWTLRYVAWSLGWEEMKLSRIERNKATKVMPSAADLVALKTILRVESVEAFFAPKPAQPTVTAEG
jgi:transcriptional regulator with XRE-family HTH domain